ncbi:MAG: hypothetical protein ACI8YQ_000620 [Polaribacter sp.]|jgi:hypothetical protein
MQPGGETIIRMGEELDLVYLVGKAAILNKSSLLLEFLSKNILLDLIRTLGQVL